MKLKKKKKQPWNGVTDRFRKSTKSFATFKIFVLLIIAVDISSQSICSIKFNQKFFSFYNKLFLLNFKNKQKNIKKCKCEKRFNY